jgi:hypothetical protein
MFNFDEKCSIAAVPVPDGYEHSTASHSPCTVWLAPKDGRGGGMVVCLFSLRHDTVRAAQEGRDGFTDVAVGGRTWRVAMPDPYEGPDSFMSILVLEDAAVAAYGTGLGWRLADLKQFLSGVRLRID